MNVLVWFRNDLRVKDHPALALAAAGSVLPLVIVDPAEWTSAPRSARQWEFRAESLRELREALAALGAPLALRVGEPLAVLEKLCRLHRIARILCHEEADCRALDARVADWAAGAGIRFTRLPPGPDAPGALRALPGVEPGPIPPARALRLAEDRCPHRQAGGRAQGLLLLQGFLERRGEGWRAGRDSAVLAERASSRLSPHLAAGTLSRAEVAEAVAGRLAERPGMEWTRSLSAFRAALLTPPAAPEPPSDAGETTHLAAFSRAETGLPIVDAALRCLSAGGWLPHRLRGLLASVALHHLALPEAAAGAVLARGLTDFAPATHWGALQRIGAGRPRDPLALAARLDPSGAFTRRWLPELAPVPDALLQQPWRWSGARTLLGRAYPEPVVDPATAARAARDRRPRPAPVPVDLLDWPGARPRARRMAAVPGQLCLDL